MTNMQKIREGRSARQKLWNSDKLSAPSDQYGKIMRTRRISRLIEPEEMQIGDQVQAAKHLHQWHRFGLIKLHRNAPSLKSTRGDSTFLKFHHFTSSFGRFCYGPWTSKGWKEKRFYATLAGATLLVCRRQSACYEFTRNQTEALSNSGSLWDVCKRIDDSVEREDFTEGVAHFLEKRALTFQVSNRKL